MLQYNKINVSQGTDINKTSKSKECMLCRYWYFKDVGYNLNHIFVMLAMLCQ